MVNITRNTFMQCTNTAVEFKRCDFELRNTCARTLTDYTFSLRGDLLQALIQILDTLHFIGTHRMDNCGRLVQEKQNY